MDGILQRKILEFKKNKEHKIKILISLSLKESSYYIANCRLQSYRNENITNTFFLLQVYVDCNIQWSRMIDGKSGYASSLISTIRVTQK